MALYYKLDKDKNLIPCESVMDWASFFEKEDRIVKQENIGEYWVSTVFLGIDHNFIHDSKRPIVFETMVFKGKASDLYQDRYSTWEEALAGHNKAVEWVKNGCNEDEL